MVQHTSMLNYMVDPMPRLYRVFRKLARVVGTRFLLESLSNGELRAKIQASTNKVESYHRFAQWPSWAAREFSPPKMALTRR